MQGGPKRMQRLWFVISTKFLIDCHWFLHMHISISNLQSEALTTLRRKRTSYQVIMTFIFWLLNTLAPSRVRTTDYDNIKIYRVGPKRMQLLWSVISTKFLIDCHWFLHMHISISNLQSEALTTLRRKRTSYQVIMTFIFWLLNTLAPSRVRTTDYDNIKIYRVAQKECNYFDMFFNEILDWMPFIITVWDIILFSK